MSYTEIANVYVAFKRHVLLTLYVEHLYCCINKPTSTIIKQLFYSLGRLI